MDCHPTKLCQRCGREAKGDYGNLCEDCWSWRQQGCDMAAPQRAKIEAYRPDDKKGTDA